MTPSPRPTPAHPTPAGEAGRATLRLAGLHCPGCADAVEAALRAAPHVTDIHLDWQANEAHVSYHPGMTTQAALERVVASTGCQCEGAGHVHPEPGPTQRLDHLHHALAVQPITMGTKHDRMQYELPATHAGHAHPAPDHAGHAGMDHDMSDPGMAGAMERDMRNKFFLALALTVPTVLYSPMGMMLWGWMPPTFGVAQNLLMLLFSTPVVLYCGWIFLAGAYHSLRRGMLNMSVLIAVGVLAAYAWRSWVGRTVVGAFAVASVVLLAFFFPLLTALPVTPDEWRARMWLTDCARPGAPTLELPDSEISSGPPPSGWCWI